MNKFIIFVLALSFGILSCNKTSYKKTAGGMPYKIWRSKDTQAVTPGVYLKLAVTQKINDSVTMTTANGTPLYLFVSNQAQQPYDVSELWPSLHLGDSLMMIQMMDTFINRNPANIPPHLKKGDRIITSLRILKILPNDSAARLDEEMEKKNFAEVEIKKIEKYLAEKNIKTVRTASGSFIEMQKEGTGELIQPGKTVSLKYTGTSWSGKKFDSNVDTSFHHTDPLTFVAGAQAMIKGFDEAVLMLKKGSVARIFIPSMLAWGGSPSSPNIKPYEAVIFDVEILDVKDEPSPQVEPGKKVDATQQKNHQ